MDTVPSSFKLASKQRDGAQVHKRYYPPLTPNQRLLASDAVDETRSSSASANDTPRSIR